MAIEKINFHYPKKNLQSVYSKEEMSALELAAATAGKVDECVEMVNGVEQSAIEARQIVDVMRNEQDNFILENDDARAQIQVDNQALLAALELENETFKANVTTDFNSFKDSTNLSKTNYENELNSSKETFNTTITNEVNTIIAEADDKINADVTTKIDALITDGTIEGLINNQILGGVKNDILSNELAFSETTGYGIISGLNVVSQAIPNMSVIISSGIAHLFNGKRVALPTDQLINIAAADPSLNRIDLIYIDSTGVLTYAKGNAAIDPTAPAPINALILAEISVLALSNTVINSNISDKRKLKLNLEEINDKANSAISKYYIDIAEFGAKPDGSNSSDAIQAAINAAKYGDIVFASTGTFIIDKTIMLKEGVTLRGTGRNTFFKMKDGANLQNMFLLSERVDRKNYDCILEDFCIDGNKINNPTGGNGIAIYCTWKSTIRNVVINYMTNHGVYWHGNASVGSNTNYIEDLLVYGCDGCGIYLSEFCSDMHINGGNYGSNKLENIMMKSPSSSINNSIAWGSRSASGVVIDTSAPSCQILGCKIEGNAKHGIEVKSSHHFISGNKIYDNSEFGNTNLYSGIFILNPSVYLENISINDNKIYSGLYGGTGIHKHAIEFNGLLHKYCSLFANDLRYSGNGIIDTTRAIVQGLLPSDVSDYSWCNTAYSVNISSNQAITGGGWAKLLFNTKAFDKDNDFDTSTNKFIAKHDGTYQFDISVMFDNVVDGTQIMLEFWVNDGTVKHRIGCEQTGGTGWYITQGSLMMNMSKGWTLSAHVYAGANVTVYGGPQFNRFSGKILR